MADEFSSLPVKKPWYKTAKGIILIIFLLLLLAVMIIFAVFFVFYIWQIRYGDVEKLAREFNSGKFTLAYQAASKEENVPVEDIGKYVRAFDPVFGAKNAKIIILFFVDFQCPFCREAYPGFKKVMEKYAPAVKFVFKNLPLAEIHADAMNVANAAACAAEQGKFWQYYDGLFAIERFGEQDLSRLSQAVGLEPKMFGACYEGKKFQTRIDHDMVDAAALDVRGTPTYFVNGVKLEGVIDSATWDKVILEFLKK